MAERKSLESIGESLLSQQRARREDADKKRRKDQRRLMVLGTLVAGQSLVNSALKDRMNEIKESNKLNMINSKIYHKNIQKAAQLYAPIMDYNIATYEDAFKPENKPFLDSFTTVLNPMLDKQIKAEGIDTLNSADRENFVNVQTNNTLKSLLATQPQWQQGLEEFGLSNQQLALGTEADLNVNLTKLSKQAQTDQAGSIFDLANLRAIGTLGFSRKGSTWDSTNTTDYNPMQGLQNAVTAIGFDKQFSESYRNFRNTSQNWVGKLEEDGQQDMANTLVDLPLLFSKNDQILKGMPAAFSELPSKRFYERKQGQTRMEEFVSYINDPENASFKKRYTDTANAFYAKLRDERGFKTKFVRDVLQLDPNSEAGRATAAILDDETGLQVFSHMYTINQVVIDNKGKSRRMGIASGKEPFEINTSVFDKLIQPKIILGPNKFEVTEEFINATKEEQREAIRDVKQTIIETNAPATSKSAVINRLATDIPSSLTADEIRQLEVNEPLLGKTQQASTDLSSIRIEQLKQDIENKVVSFVDFTGRRRTRPASPQDIENMKSQIDRFSEFDLARLRDPLQGRELQNQMERLDLQIESLEARLPNMKQTLPEDRYEAQVQRLEELRAEKENLQTQRTTLEEEAAIPELMRPRAVGEEISMNAVREIIKLNKSLNPEQLAFRETYYSRLMKAESNYGNNKNTFNSERDAIGIAQIIPSQALAEVQRRANPDPAINEGNGANTRAFNEQLKEIHDIDLLTITAKDLEKPLVNIAVMEAYTASTPKPIPTDPTEQAIYYVDTYVKYNKAKLIEELGEEEGIATYNRKRNESIENFLVNNGFRSEWNEYSKNI
jgi:uncharacterized protein (UPF0335 family)